ncbi:MAG TPA: hypothetical protein VMS22_22115 [Candidatus Eisenbacteria bacterium]|nr:hypothetical protein [Candidatus Eisenbacteria bacterium]
MRVAVITLLCAALAPVAVRAQCPPACAGGGGPAATDCFLAFGGVGGSAVACTDGDPTCDQDGTIDGTCTLAVTACTNVGVGSCPATPLDATPTAVAKGAGADAFVSAVGQLSPSAQTCTAPGLVRLSIAPSQAKLKPAVVTVRTTAVAGGKKDKDKLKLVCNPARPGLAASVQPLFTATCTYTGCHSGELPQASLSLEDGQSLAALVNQRAVRSPKLARVKPGSIKKSFLTKGLFGVGARRMPDGCPDIVTPVERCLTDAEIYTILAWIQAGALP